MMAPLFVNFTNRAGLSAESGIVAILRNALTDQDVWISPSDPEPGTEAGSIAWLKSDIVRANIGIFPFDPHTRADHYNHISLGLLWPLMHELEDRVSMAIEEMQFEENAKGEKVKVHASQLEALETRARNYGRHIEFSQAQYGQYTDIENRISLVHDFTCAGIKAEGAKANVYTVHTPFPRAEWLKDLSVDGTPLIDTNFFKDFIRRMVSYDLVTMHTDKDINNFTNLLEHMAPDFSMDALGRFKAFGMTSWVKKVHVGIDPAFIQQEAETAEFSEYVQQTFVDPIVGRKALVSVARHDYTKGTLELADTIETYFEQHPEKAENTSFVVIRQPSRSGLSGQVEYQAAADQRFAQLMEKHGDAVIYVNQGMKHPELMKFMQLPNVIGIMSLPTVHEGHDLTVREFVDVNPSGVEKAVISTRGVGAMSVLGVPGNVGQEYGAFKVDSCKDTADLVAKLDMVLSGDHSDEIRERFQNMKDRSTLFSGTNYLKTIAQLVDQNENLSAGNDNKTQPLVAYQMK